MAALFYLWSGENPVPGWSFAITSAYQVDIGVGTKKDQAYEK